MRNIQYLLIAVFGLCIVSACQRELQLDLNYNKEALVVNGIWEADSTPVHIHVCKLKGINDTVVTGFVDDAVITVFANNQPVGEMQYADSGSYVLDLIPQAGITYKIEVQKGDQKLWAETTIPSPTPVIGFSVDSIPFSSSSLNMAYYPVFKLTLDDYVNENNYYWVTFQTLDQESLLFKDILAVFSNSPYFDDFNQGIDPASSPPFNTDYGRMARLPDVKFKNDSCKIDICSRGVGDWYGIYVFNVDENYDKYLKSSIKYLAYSDMVEVFPCYYQPSFIFSNIHNGAGIFGSLATYKKVVYFYGGINIIE